MPWTACAPVSGLRAHGQKDPLIEYKQEAYGMFEELMGNIKREILSNLFRSATSLSAFEQFLTALPQNQVKEVLPGMAEMQQQREQATTNAGDAPAKELPIPIKRQHEKIGRNEIVKIRRGGEEQEMKWKKAEPWSTAAAGPWSGSPNLE
jgi:preprotein translocase subunit SecA